MQKKTVIIDGRPQERRWEVDFSPLVGIQGNEWIEEYPQLLQRDLQEMQQAFPHWFLVAGNANTPASCAIDRDFIIPSNGALRCVKCLNEHEKAATSIIWIGMLPVQITGAKKLETRIRSLIGRREMTIPYIDRGGIFYILPMAKIVYPTNWPNSQPEAHYMPGFFETLDLSIGGASHAHHMVSSSKMCLFSSWHQMSIRDVLQNRVLPHALAQVKIANGERPQRWFN